MATSRWDCENHIRLSGSFDCTVGPLRLSTEYPLDFFNGFAFGFNDEQHDESCSERRHSGEDPERKVTADAVFHDGETKGDAEGAEPIEEASDGWSRAFNSRWENLGDEHPWNGPKPNGEHEYEDADGDEWDVFDDIAFGEFVIAVLEEEECTQNGGGDGHEHARSE